MSSPEFPTHQSTGEAAATLSDRFAALAALMEPGFNQLPGNEDLEGAYLDYQAAVLDEQYTGAPNYLHFDELPEREQSQAAAMVDQLAYEGLAPASILQKRLQTTRLLQVETHTKNGRSVGGEYIKGLVVVAQQVNSQPRTPEQQNHARLHEIAHGLAAPTTLALSGSDILLFGSGLINPQRARWDTLLTLTDATEAIVDSLAVSVSDIDTAAYLAGRFPDVGYWREDRALAQFAAEYPVLARGMWEGTFGTGLQDRAKGTAFAEAFEPFLPPESN